MTEIKDQKLRSEIMACLRDTLTKNPSMTSGEFADKVIKLVRHHDKPLFDEIKEAQEALRKALGPLLRKPPAD